jgi:uncharacterized protein (TIGR02466 family)
MSEQEIKSFDIKYELMRPWTDILFRTKLPDFILQKMIEISDEIVGDPAKTPWGKNLAGQIADEPLIPHEILKRENVFGFFCNMIKEYINQCQIQQATIEFQKEVKKEKDNWQIEMKSWWVIEQRPGEYNPIHVHTDCDVSTVMYLKVPEFLPSEKPERNDDGTIMFVGDAGVQTKLKRGIIKIHPHPGEFYIFPAHMLHTVYPYRTNDDFNRRSIAFNASFTHADKNMTDLIGAEVPPHLKNLKGQGESIGPSVHDVVTLRGS